MLLLSCCSGIYVAVSSLGQQPSATTSLTETRYLLLAVIAEGLFNCQKIGSLTYLKVWVAANVFRYLANIIILYIILFPVTDRIMKQARWQCHPGIGHWIAMAFVSIFMVLFVVMWNYNLIHGVTGEETTDPKYGVEATYVTLYLVAALYAAGHIIPARIQAARIKASSQVRDGIIHSLLLRCVTNQYLQGMIPWCPMLLIGLVGYALMDFIRIFAFYVVEREYTQSASITFLILGLFFQAFMYLGVAMLAGSKALEIEELDPHEQKALHEGQATAA